MVPVIAILQKISLVLALMVGTLSRSVSSNPGCMPQEVYDIKFDYRHKCSMTVFWTTPDQQCAYGVARYIVQSAQGCPSSWKNHGPLMGNVTSLSIDDVALVTSCLLGKCYIRVIAEFERSDQTQRKISHCVGLGDGFHVSSNTPPRYSNIIGQQVCVPIRKRCNGFLPTLFVNQCIITLSTGLAQTSAGEYSLTDGPEFCISNNSDSYIVIHEFCHIDPNCPLCPEISGELVFISRAEIQSRSVVSNTTISENGSHAINMTSEEFDCLPSIVTFCASSYTVNINDVSTVEICICLPLHRLHGPDSDNIVVELSLQDNSTFPGTDVLNGSVDALPIVTLNPNSMQPQCIEVELPVQDIQYANSNTSFNLCLMLLNDSAKCVHVSEPCTGIKLTNRGGTTTTSGSITQGGDNTTTVTTLGDRDPNDHSDDTIEIVAAVVTCTALIVAAAASICIIAKIRIKCSKSAEMKDKLPDSKVKDKSSAVNKFQSSSV